MKILGIIASLRKEGNVRELVGTALDEAAKLGAEPLLWEASGKKLEGCKACFACAETTRRATGQLLKGKMGAGIETAWVRGATHALHAIHS